MSIADKMVLVTGANRGIGRALVEEALMRGASRVYAGTRQPMTHPDPRVVQLTLDVTSADQIKAVADQAEPLDILINNAGVFFFDDLGDCSALERHLAVNLYGVYDVTRAFLPALTRSRGGHRDHLVRRGARADPAHPRLLAVQGCRVQPDAGHAHAARGAGGTGARRAVWPGRCGPGTGAEAPGRSGHPR
jgi:NAD(P)-dependent dehydrogenase (short-subunit alcohol dehydrogenase family)